MKIIQRYFASAILKATGLTLLLLVGVDLMFSLVSEIKHLGESSYTLITLAVVVVCQLPHKLYLLFPIAALMGTLIGLGQLAEQRELVILRAQGLSLWRFIRGVSLAMALMVLGNLILGEWLTPLAEQVGQQQKAMALSDGRTLQTSQGAWLRDGKSFIHIDKIFLGGHLEGLSFYHFGSDFQLQSMQSVRYADYLDEHWLLTDIHTSEITPQSVQYRHTPNEQWDSPVSPQLLSVLGVKYLENLSMRGLLSTIQYRGNNGLDNTSYWVAFYEKAFKPVATVVMMLLALPFVFGSLRHAGQGKRWIIGGGLGLGFYLTNEMAMHLVMVLQGPIWLGAASAPLLFAVLAIWLLRRVY